MTGRDVSGTRPVRRRGETTMAMIAHLAGVSTPTVSRVLNGRSGVASQTRQQIEALLREHGYRRPTADAPAPSLEVVFYGLESSIGIAILRGVESVVRERGFVVGFTEVREPVSAAGDWAGELLARRPIGVIATHSYFTEREHALLTTSGIPLVALDPSGMPPEAVPSVSATNWNGGVAAARHVVELGHRRIALISGPAKSLIARARLEACRAVLDAVGVPLEEELVRSGPFHFEDGLALGQELLARPERPTAIICGNDLQALGVYEAARRAGLTIPGDVSVVGFDDLTSTLRCGPPMTTVRQPFQEMGAAAARLVLAFADGEKPEHTRVELPTTLVVRGSTGPPAPR